MTKIRDLLASPLRQLSEIDKVIKRFEENLKGLKEKRNEIHNHIQTYQTVLSPARRLPPDILREIFLFCLTTERNSILSASEAPMLLTRVCSAWRALAFSFPRLWARLHVPLIGNAQGPMIPWGVDRQFPIDDTAHFSTMNQRRQVVEEWLARSGDCPLSISISYPLYQSLMGDHLETSMLELLEVLSSQFERWENLELSMPLDVYYIFQNQFSAIGAKKLRKLRVYFAARERTGDGGTINRPIPLFAAPNLRHVSFNGIPSSWHILSFPIAPTWGNLISLALHSSIGDVDVLDLLKLTPCLVYCRLSIIAKFGPNDMVDIDSILAKGIVHLPHLETLSVNDNGSVAVMVPTCRAIDAPILRWLDYYRPAFYAQNIGESNSNNQQCVFLPLLVNAASTLKQLSCEPVLIKNLMVCLRTPEELRHLVLGSEPLSMRRPERFRFGRPPMACPSFDFANLIVPENDDPPEGNSEKNLTPVFLPYLQVLEAYQLRDVTDQCLLDVIGSRLRRFSRGNAPTSPIAVGTASTFSDPTTDTPLPNLPTISTIVNSLAPPLSNGIVAIRRVILEFDRPQEMDIKDELNNIAKEAGVDFRIEAFYAPNTPSNLNPHSASFGLDDEGRSWTYSNTGGSAIFNTNF